MEQIHNGNIESLSSIVQRINTRQKFRLFPTNEITQARLKNDRLQISGMFCTCVGHLIEESNTLTIDLKVRLRRQFAIIGIFLLIFFSGFIWGENVTINGDPDPSIWKRTGLFLIGLTFFSIPVLILRKLRNDFEKKVIDVIKQ